MKPYWDSGFNVDILFEYSIIVKGETHLDWAHGTADEIMNKSINRVLIEWNDECHGKEKEAAQQLLITKQNPKQNTYEGA